MSDIRVSVQWKSASVFAGEDLECIITFQNTSQAHQTSALPLQGLQDRFSSSGRERWKGSLPHHPARSSIGHTRNNSFSAADAPAKILSKSHKPGLSLSNAQLDTRVNPAITSTEIKQPGPGDAQNGKHRRSVSIVSVTGDPYATQYESKQAQTSTSRRPARNHTRAASLQVLPYRGGNNKGGPTSGMARHAPQNNRFELITYSQPQSMVEQRQFLPPS